MILVACANAGVDRTYLVPGFSLGGFHHPEETRTAAGGKGINVARVLRGLGDPVTVTGFVGGHSGRLIADELLALGARPQFVSAPGESRSCINIVDPLSGRCTRVDEWGPELDESHVEGLRRRWAELLPECELAIISGSAPPGAPASLYRDLALAAHRAQRPVVLDAHDEPLALALEAGPDVIKPNQEELEALAGRELGTVQEIVSAALSLTARGVGTVIASLAQRGAIAVTGDGECVMATPPAVEALNPVGGGDALVAGYAHAMRAGLPLDERLRWAVAAGTASTLTLGAAACGRDEVERLLPGVIISRLDRWGAEV